jgi:hypothetical protein
MGSSNRLDIAAGTWPILRGGDLNIYPELRALRDWLRQRRQSADRRQQQRTGGSIALRTEE